MEATKAEDAPGESSFAPMDEEVSIKPNKNMFTHGLVL